MSTIEIPENFQRLRDSNLATISRPPHPETSQNHLNLQGFGSKKCHVLVQSSERSRPTGNSRRSNPVEEVKFGWTWDMTC